MSGHAISWIESTLGAAPGILLEFSGAGREERVFHGGCVDSRGDCAGRIFFAVRGERVDGHEYVRAAFEAGCAVAVVEREETAAELRENNLPFARVATVRGALGLLAAGHRAAVGARVVAVTGSSGKTSTKEYIRALLRLRYRVHASAGNLNSTIGAPLAVLDADADAQYLVCEVGANRAGEIDEIATVLEPDVGVVTNIGDAHVGHFGSRERIAQAKSELLRKLDRSEHAVLPLDDEFFDTLSRATPARVLTFGEAAGCDVRVEGIRVDEMGTSFTVGQDAFHVPALGRYHALNAAAAIAVGDICGVDRAEMGDALAATAPMAGRGRLHRARGATVIDESYNASPASVVRSIAMLADIEATRRVAILGDMKELGVHEQRGAREVAAALARSGIDLVLWYGNQADDVGRVLAQTPCRFETFDGVDDLTRRAFDVLEAGAVVLVKASRSCGLDETVRKLTENPNPAGK